MELKPFGNDNDATNLYCNNCKAELDYNQNFFTVRFAVPELRTPEKARFSCKLEGFETTGMTWVQAAEYLILMSRRANTSCMYAVLTQWANGVNPLYSI